MSTIPGRFQKGVCPNPNGRPKGSLSEQTKQYMKIKGLAAEKYEDAFRLLWEAMEAKEGWAHQLYFKELVPKRLHQPTVLVEPSDNTVESQITSLRKGLAEFTEHTEESLLNALKALNSIKSNEIVANQTSSIIETREELGEKIKAMQEIINYAKNQKNGNDT
jgi:hypothetical protein